MKPTNNNNILAKIYNKKLVAVVRLLLSLLIITAVVGLEVLVPMAGRGETRPFPDEYDDEAEEANLPDLYTDDFNENLAQNPLVSIVDSATMQFTCKIPGICNTDDNKLYLYQLPVYEYSISAGQEAIASVDMTNKPVINYALNHKQADTRLYSKFILAVKDKGQVVPVSQARFVDNPEFLATHTHARRPYPFKGTQQEYFTNLMIDSSCSTAPSYCLNMVQIMNDGHDQIMTHPKARHGVGDSHPISKNYYMLNANDADGVSRLAHSVEYYAANCQRTDDWIVGNEVNVRIWNYMAFTSWDDYIRQYEQEFRICYIAIKSNNANAQVYTCFEQNWDMNYSSGAYYYVIYDSKDFLLKFNEDIKATGDCDWGLAFHPYTNPLTYIKFWDMSGCPGGANYAAQVANNQIVTFQNLGVVTSFLEQENMRSPSGEVRHFSLTEIAFSNAQGDANQAAAICACYVAAKRTGYATHILYSNMYHGPTLDARLTGPTAYDMYNNMDGARGADLQNWALAHMGYTSWGQVLR